MTLPAAARPAGVTALGCLFLLGAVVSCVSEISLRAPGGFLEPMWRLNPRARDSFSRMGAWAPILLGVVCLACVACAYGFLAGRRWGYRLGVVGLFVNLAGDVANAVLGDDPRAVVGVPIVGLVLWYLFSRRVRTFFGLPKNEAVS
jgi:hypothetical protein